MEFREELIVEWEKSKAHVQASKIIEVTRVYEIKKKEVEDNSLFSQDMKD